ncbi:MAG: hypothetical protein K2M50_08215 [Treponemataceae bacterium]|nr:hypothetical protein [Treponemataceae bacterium]
MIYKKMGVVNSVDEYNKLFNKSEKSKTHELVDGQSCTVRLCGKDGEEKTYTLTVPSDFADSLHGSKWISAYNTAADTRKFEIELFWKRSTFFWAFIAAIYTAYFHVLTNIYKNVHGAFALVVLSALGLFFCVSWYFASKASKHWQENWESHIDLLEDDITGPLFKTHSSEQSYSVSKIAITAGLVVSICSYGLLVYEFMNMVKYRLQCSTWLQIILTVTFAVFVVLCLFVYSRHIAGNQSGRRAFSFITHKDED